MRATAFLALWNGVDNAQVTPEEYETWHSFEHVPERVGLPGFIEARRYRRLDDAADAGPLYYTCYWLQTREALATPEYREVLAHPTLWSARMRGALTDFLRLPCELQATYGVSSGVYLSVLRLRATDAKVLAASLTSMLPALVTEASILCAHWGWAYPTNDFPMASAGVVPVEGHGQEAVLMLQHLDLTTLRTSTEYLQRVLSLRAVICQSMGDYGLLTQVRQTDLTAPLERRQPARPQLMQRFLSGDKVHE
jgi:hypothetical protein